MEKAPGKLGVFFVWKIGPTEAVIIVIILWDMPVLA